MEDPRLADYAKLLRIEPYGRCEALEARLLVLEEMLKPSKVQADSWSIPVGQ